MSFLENRRIIPNIIGGVRFFSINLVVLLVDFDWASVPNLPNFARASTLSSYCLLSGRIDGCRFSLNWDKIFRAHITLGSSSGASILRRFESDSFDKLQPLTINDRRSKMTHVASPRNRLTLCIVIREDVQDSTHTPCFGCLPAAGVLTALT